jgi:hypothetical protein
MEIKISHEEGYILAGCSSFVAVVLTRCKLDKFFEIAETAAEAIRTLLND